MGKHCDWPAKWNKPCQTIEPICYQWPDFAFNPWRMPILVRHYLQQVVPKALLNKLAPKITSNSRCWYGVVKQSKKQKTSVDFFHRSSKVVGKSCGSNLYNVPFRNNEIWCQTQSLNGLGQTSGSGLWLQIKALCPQTLRKLKTLVDITKPIKFDVKSSKTKKNSYERIQIIAKTRKMYRNAQKRIKFNAKIKQNTQNACLT